MAEAFNKPRITIAESKPAPVANGGSPNVKARANRREPKPCGKCKPHGNSYMCKCNGCEKVKDLSFFYYSKSRGHDGNCMDCKQATVAAYSKKAKKALKRSVATARKSRRAKTISKEARLASRLKSTKGDVGLRALIDTSQFLAKTDRKAWVAKLEGEIREAKDHIQECEIALALLKRLK